MDKGASGHGTAECLSWTRAFVGMCTAEALLTVHADPSHRQRTQRAPTDATFKALLLTFATQHINTLHACNLPAKLSIEKAQAAVYSCAASCAAIGH